MSAKKSEPKMRTPLVSASMFYKYEACPHWLWFDEFGDPKKKQKTPKFSEMLMQQGLLHEQDVISRRDYIEVKGRGNAARFKTTLKLMQEGVDRIYHGVLKDGDMVGEPDILEKKTDRSSNFGAYHYIAIDIKSAEKINDSHKYQLVFYGELLKKIQGVRPEDGCVLNGSHVLLCFSLREFEQQFHEALGEVREILAGKKPAPYLSSGCKNSPWFKECIAYAEETMDVTLLYNLRQKTLDKLRAEGVKTVKDAVKMDVDELHDEKSTSMSRSTLERLALQAGALLENKHYIRRPYEFPKPAVEIFFDIEGDPLRQVEYLFGFLIREGADERYEYQLAEAPEDEGKMWKEFLKWIEKLPDAYAVYHYGTYEKARISILEGHYGGSKALDRFRDRLIDLNEVVKKCVVFPLYFYGIKNIGQYIGFDRSKKIAGGAESVAYYEDWLTKKDRKKLDAILLYNEDDVVATRALKDWLEKERAAKATE